MKKSSVLIVSFFLSTLVVSCSQPEQRSKHQHVDEKSVKSSNEIHQSNKARAAFSGNRTISINGEKYLFTGDKLQKGSQVRNVHMSEKGRIKGSFVVISKADELGKIQDITFKRKTKIAKNTFRLMPMSGDDLMAVYKLLLTDKNIIRVELEIDYSPINNTMAY